MNFHFVVIQLFALGYISATNAYARSGQSLSDQQIQILPALKNTTGARLNEEYYTDKSMNKHLVWGELVKCPESHYVYGVSPLYYSFLHDTGKTVKYLTGLKVLCVLEYSGETAYESVVVPPPSSNSSEKNLLNITQQSFPEWKLCPINQLGIRGYSVGHEIKRSYEGNPKGILDFVMYCDDMEELLLLDPKSPKKNKAFKGTWKSPKFCPLGTFHCGLQGLYGGADQNILLDVKFQCCGFYVSEPVGWKDYRESKGGVLSSPTMHSKQLSHLHFDNYYDKALEHPYFYKWKFCPLSTYAAGFQLNYVDSRIRLICFDPTLTLASREVTELSMETEPITLFWSEEEDLSEPMFCDGIITGVQFKYTATFGITGVRFFCSFKTSQQRADYVPYIEARFKLPPNPQSREGRWHEPQVCGANQAVCGFTRKLNHPEVASLESHLEHMKLKCCNVPSIAEVCLPEDRFELVVECDATFALAESVCSYRQSEGLSTSSTYSEEVKRENSFRESISRELSFSSSDNRRTSETETIGKVEGQSLSTSNTRSNSTNRGTSSSQNENESISSSNSGSLTGSSGSSVNANRGGSSGQSWDSSRSSSDSKNIGETINLSNSVGRSGSRTESDSTQSSATQGGSAGSSKTHTQGVSRGEMSSNTLATSENWSQSRSNTKGGSRSSHSSNTHTRGSSTTDSESKTHSAGFSLIVSYNFEHTSQNSKTNSEESSSTSGSSSTKDWSSSNSNSHGGERSNSRSNQRNTETSESESGTHNNERNWNNQRTLGFERQRQQSVTANREVSHGQSANVGREESQSSRLGGTREINFNIGQTETFEQQESQTAQKGRESSKGKQETRAEDVGKSHIQTENVETSIQRSKQMGTEQGRDRGQAMSEGRTKGAESGLTTGFDWSKTTSNTWSEERSVDMSMTVLPGIRAQLFQVVGYCGHYQVKTTKFRRVDKANEEFLHQLLEPYLKGMEKRGCNTTNLLESVDAELEAEDAIS